MVIWARTGGWLPCWQSASLPGFCTILQDSFLGSHCPSSLPTHLLGPDPYSSRLLPLRSRVHMTELVCKSPDSGTAHLPWIKRLPGLFFRSKSLQLITGPSAVPFCSIQMVFHYSGAGHTCQNWWVIHLKVELLHSLDSVFQDPSHSSCHLSSSPVPLLKHALNPSVFLQLRHKSLHQNRHKPPNLAWTDFSSSDVGHTSQNNKSRPHQS